MQTLHLPVGFLMGAAAVLPAIAQSSEPTPQAAPLGQVAPANASFSLQDPGKNTNYKSYWRDGNRFETNDLQFTYQIGGRINVDWSFFSGDSEIETEEDLSDKVDLRRLHLNMGGTIYETIRYFYEFDFGPAVTPDQGNRILLKDAYIQLPGLGVGTLTIGQQFEPFGFETQTEQNHNTFLERSLADSLAPRRGTGLKYSGDSADHAFTWALGLFNSNTANGPDAEIEGNESWGGTGRATYAFTDLGSEANSLLHLGVSYSGRSTAINGVSYQTRPEAYSTMPWISTDGTLDDANSVQLLGFELATVLGPFSIQGEYIQANIDMESTDDPGLDGYYIQASYFLTGETRPYKNGLFDRIRPTSNWKGLGNGIGAWEVALRFSEADYSDAAAGQELQNFTIGLNWYLNPNMRFQANYITIEDSEYTDGTASAITLRTELVF